MKVRPAGGRTWGWAARTVVRGAAASRSVVVLAVLLVTASVALAALAGTVRAASHEELVADGSLGQVDLSTPVGDAGRRPLTTSALASVRALPGVTAVEPDYPVSVAWGERGVLFAGHTAQAQQRREVTAGEQRTPRDGEVAVPEVADGTDMRPYLGKDLTLTVTEQTGEGVGQAVPVTLRVVTVYRAAPGSEPNTALLSPGDSATWAALRAGQPRETFLATTGARSALVQTASVETARTVATALRAQQFDARAVADRVDDVAGLPALIGIGSWLVAGAALLFYLLSSLSRASEASRRRLREFAVLRSLGWSRRGLRVLLVQESVLLSAATVVLSLVAGLALAGLLTGQVTSLALGRAAPLAVPWAALLPVVLSVPAVATLGALAGARRALRADPYLVAREQV